jgi:hypothetical protein
MQRMEGSGTPVLYIGRTVLKSLIVPINCKKRVSSNNSRSLLVSIQQLLILLRGVGAQIAVSLDS